MRKRNGAAISAPRLLALEDTKSVWSCAVAPDLDYSISDEKRLDIQANRGEGV